MLYYLLTSLAEELAPLNVFRYLTTRTGMAILTALIFIFLFGPRIISLLKVKQGRGQPIRTDGPQRHLVEKQGTPTMGGLMILSGIFVATLLWADLSNLYVWAVLFVTLGYGAIGFYDDYLKVTKSSTSGFSGKVRLLLEARHRRHRDRELHVDRRQVIVDGACRAVLQGRAHSVRRVLPPVRRLRRGRRRQCRQPHRRAGRACHRAGDDRGGELRAHRLSRRQRGLRRLSAIAFRQGHRRARRPVRRDRRRRRWASCGSTRRRP